MTNFLRNFDKVNISSGVYDVSTAEKCAKIIFIIPLFHHSVIPYFIVSYDGEKCSHLLCD